MKEVFSQIFARKSVQILVNNAGSFAHRQRREHDETDFDRVFRVNVKGFYNCIHACVGQMKANGGGVILNMASIAGSAGLARSFRLLDEQGRRDRDDVFRRQGLRPVQHSLQLHFACTGAYAVRRRLPAKELSRARAGNVRKTGEVAADLGEWANPRKSPRSRFFFVPTMRRLSPARTIRWTAAFFKLHG